MARPVLATRSAGLIEYLCDGEDSRLLPVADVAAWRSAILRRCDTSRFQATPTLASGCLVLIGLRWQSRSQGSRLGRGAQCHAETAFANPLVAMAYDE